MLKNSFQPLYKQVYDVLTERLVAGHWKAGDLLPSEFGLASELGVSQGTVRKALNQMVDEKLLLRRQGKGTYVAEHTDESSFTRFFRLHKPDERGLMPETQVLSIKRRAITKQLAKRFNISTKEKVNELMRLRFIDSVPAMVEKVINPCSLFPDIDKMSNLPNSLYILYQEVYGVNIVSVRDEVKAEIIPDNYTELLALEVGTPVLRIERESVSIDGRVVEWSTSYCNTADFSYGVEMS